MILIREDNVEFTNYKFFIFNDSLSKLDVYLVAYQCPECHHFRAIQYAYGYGSVGCLRRGLHAACSTL